MPIDVGVVAGKPGEIQHHQEVRKLNYVEGNVFCRCAMNPQTGGEVVCNRGGRAAINELHGDRVGVRKGCQVGLKKN